MIMKRILLLLAGLWALGVEAADVLSIFSVTGDVYMINQGGREKAARRAVVSPSTTVDIPAGGVVKILEQSTGRVFSSREEGRITVKDIISREEARSAGIVAGTNRKILDAARNSSQGGRQRFGTGGVSMHNVDAANADSLSLSDLFASPDRCDHTDVVLLRREHNVSDSTFHFVVFNTLDHPVYVNIVSSLSTPVQRLFPKNILVKPRGATDLDQYEFSLHGGNSVFALVASEEDFTETDLDGLVTSPLHGFHLSLLSILGK